MFQKYLNLLALGAVSSLFVPISCTPADEPNPRVEVTRPMSIKLTSPAFKQGEAIPKNNTGDGEDFSPPLNWEGAPAETQSLTLICDDPDAPVGNWVHWVLYDLPPNHSELVEGIPASPTLSNGARQGVNDFRKIGYGGPAPPRGKPHRYFFRIYALDTVLSLKPGVRKPALLEAMEGHIIAEGELMGTYQRV